MDELNLRAAIEAIGLKTKNQQPIDGKHTKEDIDLLYSLGTKLYKLGHYRKAEKVFRKLLMLSPLEKNHWMGFAGCMQQQSQYEAAMPAWAMLALIDTADATPHFHAAECLLMLEQYTEAKKALDSAKERLKTHQDTLEKDLNVLEKVLEKHLKNESVYDYA